MECFIRKWLTAFSGWLFLRNTPSKMFERVVNFSLDYSGCFVIVLREINLNVWYMPYWLKYSLQTPQFWSHPWKYNIQANERLTKVKEKWSTIQFDVLIFLLFSSFQCHRQVVSKTELVRAIFCTHQTSGACADVCACDSTHQMESELDKINNNNINNYNNI